MIRLAFRFDDPALTSDHALERRIVDTFRNAGCPLTCAVVPFCCDSAKPRPITAEAVPHLVDAQRSGHVEVALHGFCHREHARMKNRCRTELVGIAKDHQRELLLAGKSHLEEVFSTRIGGFVPPWNSYDRVTLDLLPELGFSYVSASWDLVSEDSLPIPVIPRTCNLVHLKEAVAEARQYAPLDSVVVGILHHFDFSESGDTEARTDLSELSQLLAWTRNQPDLDVTTIAYLAEGLVPERCAASLRLARRSGKMHWRLQRLLPRYVFLHAGRLPLWTSLTKRALLQLPHALAGRVVL